MSHVDDGILHAYLDGELSAVERARIEAHLADCAACRSRLEDERALVGRAAQLLAAAAPPEHEAPPLQQLGRARGRRRFVTPLTWAATVALALMTGWYARGGDGGPGTGEGLPAAGPAAPDGAPTPVVSESERAGADTRSEASAPGARTGADRPAEPAPTGVASGVEARVLKTAAQERDSEIVLDGALIAAPGRAPADRADERQKALEETATPPPAPKAAVAVSDDIRMRGGAPGAAPQQRLVPRDLVSTTWRVIAREPARTLLGTEPVAVPGLPIRQLRESPLGDGIVLVEQQLDAGRVIQLFQQRATLGQQAAGREAREAAQLQSANERLARYVDGLRVEISGPLDTDSLNKLLESVRPIPE